MYNQGDILIDDQGNRRKVLGVCGEAVFLSERNNEHKGSSIWTEFEIEDLGYRIEEPQWRPCRGDRYYIVNTTGEAHESVWDAGTVDESRMQFGNVFRTRKEAQQAAGRVQKALKGEV